MKPILNEGEFVFCSLSNNHHVDFKDILCLFKENEGTSIIISKKNADELKLSYSFVSSWITLSVHSSLESVGLTAAFSNILAEFGISCNVVAAYFHDHIFVNTKDAEKAMNLLEGLSKN